MKVPRFGTQIVSHSARIENTPKRPQSGTILQSISLSTIFLKKIFSEIKRPKDWTNNEGKYIVVILMV